jgi:hypothetical protein
LRTTHYESATKKSSAIITIRPKLNPSGTVSSGGLITSGQRRVVQLQMQQGKAKSHAARLKERAEEAALTYARDKETYSEMRKECGVREKVREDFNLEFHRI